MAWKKLGKIYHMRPLHPKLNSHASNPLAVHLYDDVFRVFFSARDKKNRSSVGSVDIDILKLTIVKECDKPIISFGSKDSFYSHGISIGNLYSEKERNYILFMGWNIRNNEHWRGDIGRLEVKKNFDLNLNSKQPFLTTDKEDEISLSYPFVMFHEGIYKMWYGSTLDWHSENGEMIHVIKYATSSDGTNWVKHGIAIPFEIGKAQAFSRPIVLFEEKTYHMWYSYRSGDGTKYRIGYSKSFDGMMWECKNNESGIHVADSGWDSEMICYPFVIEHKNNKYMLYNGNEFGKYGFGIAIWEN